MEVQVLRLGERLEEANAAVILLHGRGASAADILMAGEPLIEPGFAFIAPNAPKGAWYPLPFTAPLEDNEPWLTYALDTVAQLLADVERYVPAERVVLLGFSQGACLALEFAARHARRFGGLIGWAGGLIGPDGSTRADNGSFDGTPVVLGCAEQDPYIPAYRVRETADVLTRLGAAVDLQLYPDLGHEVNADELKRARDLLAGVSLPH